MFFVRRRCRDICDIQKKNYFINTTFCRPTDVHSCVHSLNTQRERERKSRELQMIIDLNCFLIGYHRQWAWCELSDGISYLLARSLSTSNKKRALKIYEKNAEIIIMLSLLLVNHSLSDHLHENVGFNLFLFVPRRIFCVSWVNSIWQPRQIWCHFKIIYQLRWENV